MVVGKFILRSSIMLTRMAFEAVVLRVVFCRNAGIANVRAMAAPRILVTHAWKAIGQALRSTKVLDEELSCQRVIFWLPVKGHDSAPKNQRRCRVVVKLSERWTLHTVTADRALAGGGASQAES